MDANSKIVWNEKRNRKIFEAGSTGITRCCSEEGRRKNAARSSWEGKWPPTKILIVEIWLWRTFHRFCCQNVSAKSATNDCGCSRCDLQTCTSGVDHHHDHDDRHHYHHQTWSSSSTVHKSALNARQNCKSNLRDQCRLSNSEWDFDVNMPTLIVSV